MQKNIIKKGDPNYIAKFKDSIRIFLIFIDFHHRNYIITHMTMCFFVAFLKYVNIRDIFWKTICLFMRNASKEFKNKKKFS